MYTKDYYDNLRVLWSFLSMLDVLKLAPMWQPASVIYYNKVRALAHKSCGN